MQMFPTSRKPEPTPATIHPDPSLARPATPPSSNHSSAPQTRGGGYVSSDVSINGSLKFRDEMLIDGEVEGSIDSEGRLNIGKNARVKADITTRTVVVDGKVEGNITAVERCELRAGCSVNGDITAPRLVVDEEAAFIGSARIATKPAAES